MGCLDHGDDMVRAYAARALGNRYSDSSAEPSPSLRDFLTVLTAKELERPGIAGPFFSNWYSGLAMDDFILRAGVEVEDWFCTILAGRKHPEPDTLPCSNGIDFFAHEIFGGRAGYVRKLLDMGHRELALDAATEVDERIEDLEPILLELGDAAEPEICRRASWHLAYHYRRLHAAGGRGIRCSARLAERRRLFINLTEPADGPRYAYSATIVPRGSETFDEAAGAAALEAVLPHSMRGDLQPYGIPGDGGEPSLYIFGRSASARYACGALVQFRGDPEAKRWDSIRVIWHGTPGAWRPEELA